MERTIKAALLMSLLVVVLLAMVATPLRGQSSARPPNIFLIFSDDAGQRDFGCYESPVVRTPQIDRLAAQGMRFTNMLTTSPSCTPSRASLYTGLYPIRNGAHPNHSEVKPGTKSIVHYMRSLGYRVLLLSKTMEGPLESFPFEYYKDPEPSGLGQGGSGQDLKRILANPGDKPLCLILAKFSAHSPWPHNNSHYDPNTVDIPRYYVDTPETRDLRARYYSKVTEMDEAVGRVLELLKKHNLENNTLTIYTADHGPALPRGKFNLYEAGLRVPFIVRWPGRMKPGSVSDALVSYVDIVPTFIDVAGGDVAKVVSRAGGKELDGKSFLPVLKGEKEELHSEVFGCFTWEVLAAYPMRAIRTKTHKYIWNIDSHFRYPWPADIAWWGSFPKAIDVPPTLTASTELSRVLEPMMRSWLEKAKTDSRAAEIVRAEQFRPPEELYDVRSDPDELKNLAEDPAQKELLDSLRSRLRAWMQQQGDTGDSAYHKEVNGTSLAVDGQRKRFLDEFYDRQVVVNLAMYPISIKAARVELTCSIWQADIRYTLDGSEPTRDSKLFVRPFIVEAPLKLRAKGFFKGGETPVKTIEITDLDNYRFHYQYHFKPSSF